MAIKTAEGGKPPGLAKCPTGIAGLDEATGGGLPAGRPTLVCGSAGCGKTLLAMEFLVHGATRFAEPGVFLAFEESVEELTQNVRSLGFDLGALAGERKVVVDYVHVERNEIEETGEYDLEGLFIRLGYAIDSIGAKRVVLDTIETLFAGLSNAAVIRSELRRLFRWLKDKGVTAVVTGERGDGALTRNGLEEYVSDCVILLDHRVTDQVSTRRLRIVKYRGSVHGTNEFPFLIDEGGISVLPITSLGLDHRATLERVSTGIPRLDTMLGGEGYYRGSSVLVSGTAGTGKTSIAAHFADETCRRGERCLYFAFEESSSQLVRNMRSIGLDLQPWLDRGVLAIHPSRPTFFGLEMHLATMHKRIREFEPDAVVVDPVSNLSSAGTLDEANSMVTRLIDFLKSRQTTALFTDLTAGRAPAEQTQVGISSLIDTWLLVRELETHGERNRGLYVLKSRGMAHSHQVREMLLTSGGIELTDVYLGPEGMLTGTARLNQELREKEAAAERHRELDRRRRGQEQKRKLLEAQILSLEMELEAGEEEVRQMESHAARREERLDYERGEMARSRMADANHAPGSPAGFGQGASE